MLWALFLLIGAIWALFLIPPMWADRRSFFRDRQRRGRVAERNSASGDTRTTVPMTQAAMASRTYSHEMLARRKNRLIGLVVAVAGSLAMFLLLRAIGLLILHILTDLALIAYIATLRRLNLRRTDGLTSRSIEDQMQQEYMYSPPARAASYR